MRFTVSQDSTAFQLFLNGLVKYFGSVGSELDYSRKRIVRWLNERPVEDAADSKLPFSILANRIDVLDKKFDKITGLLEQILQGSMPRLQDQE